MQLVLSLVLSYYFAVSPGDITITIPPSMNLQEAEVRACLPGSISMGDRYDRIELVIYYFSEGIEKFSYGDSGAMKETLGKGEIRALVKLKKAKVLRKALFISASGNNRSQLLDNFSRVLTDTLASNR